MAFSHFCALWYGIRQVRLGAARRFCFVSCIDTGLEVGSHWDDVRDYTDGSRAEATTLAEIARTTPDARAQTDSLVHVIMKQSYRI